jgi:hypothetical protein
MEVRWCAYSNLITILACKGIFTYLYFGDTRAYIYIYICMQVGIKCFAHTNLITIYIFYISIFYLYMYTHSTHEIFYMNKINDETFPLGVGVASGPSAPYGTRLGTDGSGL